MFPSPRVSVVPSVYGSPSLLSAVCVVCFLSWSISCLGLFLVLADLLFPGGRCVLRPLFSSATERISPAAHRIFKIPHKRSLFLPLLPAKVFIDLGFRRYSSGGVGYMLGSTKGSISFSCLGLFQRLPNRMCLVVVSGFTYSYD